MHACMFVCLYGCMYVSVSLRVYVMHACMHVGLHVCMHACMHARIHMICVYACMSVCLFLCVHRFPSHLKVPTCGNCARTTQLLSLWRRHVAKYNWRIREPKCKFRIQGKFVVVCALQAANQKHIKGWATRLALWVWNKLVWTTLFWTWEMLFMSSMR